MPWKKKDEEIILRTVYERMLELEKKKVYEPGSISLQFKEEIRKLGFDFQISLEVERICQENPKITRNVILKYYNKAILQNERAYLIDCLASEYNKDLVPLFLKEYVKPEYNTIYNMVITSIGHFLKINADRKYAQDYINILNMQKEDMIYGKAYIIMVCEKLKLEEAINPMLELLKEDPDCTHTILHAFRKYKDPQFLPIFQEYLNNADTDIRNEAKKGIASIEKMLSKNKK